MQGLEQLHAQWSAIRPRYEKLVRWALKKLLRSTRQIGLPCEITGRVKEIDSFLKKCVRKEYNDPMTDMVDKAGVRLVVAWPDGLKPVDQLVRHLFNVTKADDHWTSDEQIFGYAAVHYDVTLNTGRFANMQFEIQVHTPGQHLWADVAHKLAYKGVTSPDPKVSRRLHRLAALLEVFDQEVELAREMIINNPSYKAAYAMSVLAKHYYRLTGRAYDDALSVYLLEALGDLIPDAATERFASEMDMWIHSHRQRLKKIFIEYEGDTRIFLLFQPESLFIFRQLDEDHFTLEAEWTAKNLGEELLIPLASIWGVEVFPAI